MPGLAQHSLEFVTTAPPAIVDAAFAFGVDHGIRSSLARGGTSNVERQANADGKLAIS